MSAPAALLEALLGGDAQQAVDTAQAVKAVAWARVSTEMQEEHGLSLPEQLREIREYAGKHGIEIVAESSEAASAFQKEHRRIEFRRMLEKARADREVTLILVHDFSRFSRDSTRAKQLVRELRTKGVKVHSLNDPDIDPETSSGVYIEAFTFAKNEAYSRDIAMHTKKGCRANVRTRDPKSGWAYKNGGQPLFGYKSVRLVRGEEKRGRPIIKSIWMPDDTMVNGRPVHEWARECLLMAARGASLDTLRDFCNANGIPARRKRYWSQGTWHSLLQPAVLAKYCGHEVWNVHRKNGTVRPSSEWEAVKDAHPALISEEEALAIATARGHGGKKRFDRHNRHTKTSQYLLSGGTFRCSRCGSNMVGYYSTSGRYYLCGSVVYRRGLGCGPGVYVRQAEVEEDVIEGLRGMLNACADAEFVREVNDELRAVWEASNGHDRDAVRRLEAVDRQTGNVRQAIVNGLEDVAWANAELRRLTQEREGLEKAATRTGKPPRIDSGVVATYLQRLDRTLLKAGPAEVRGLIRECVDEMTLEPEEPAVDIWYMPPPWAMETGCESSDTAAHRDRRGSGGGIWSRFGKAACDDRAVGV